MEIVTEAAVTSAAPALAARPKKVSELQQCMTAVVANPYE